MIYSFKLQTNGSFSFQNYRTRPIYFYSVLKEMATQGNIYLWMILFSANLKSLFIKEEKVANNDFRNRVLWECWQAAAVLVLPKLVDSYVLEV